MTDKLQTIIDAHLEMARRDQRDARELIDEAEQAPPPRDFAGALRTPGLSVIAELKRRSPSMGNINNELDPVALAEQYEQGGAACISVLTDEEFFGGSKDDLKAVRHSVELPILRKDFTVDVRDIADARIMGADAVLLIAACLSDEQLAEFSHVASRLQLTTLVETHDEIEVDRAVKAGAQLIGVNQRDLTTFEVDHHAAARVYPHLPSNVVSVAESAIRSVEDAHRLHGIGYDAVLVGTTLLTHDEPAALVRAMVEPSLASRPSTN